MKRTNIPVSLCILFCSVLLNNWANAQPIHQREQKLSLDVKSTDVRDVVRMISKGYGINIIIDPEAKGSVTLHLDQVPVFEALKAIGNTSGLELFQDGSIYYLRLPPEESSLYVTYKDKMLTLDAKNADVNKLIDELSTKTGTSIITDPNLYGSVTGKLYRVDLDDGLRALLEGSGYIMTRQKDIYRISMPPDRPLPGQKRLRSTELKPFVRYTNHLISLNVKEVDLADLIHEIAAQAEIAIVTYGEIKGTVNAMFEQVTLDETLALILGGTPYTFARQGDIILVGDRSSAISSGVGLTQTELIHVRYLKAEEVAAILPKNIPLANIKVFKDQNALLVTGTSEDILQLRTFINTVDIPTPQVVIDAIVVEYSSDFDRDFGLEFGLDPRVGNQHSFPSVNFSRQGEEARKFVEKIVGKPILKQIGYLGDEFYIRLRMLVQDNKAKVLAQPSITVLNGRKASINVGQTQYYKIVTGTNENQTLRFQPISFGINLSITPWISPGGQITTDITPEISNAMGINADGYPNVFTRSINTTVRLGDGQTLVLGGLLRRDEQVSSRKAPILGSIPLIGFLFNSTKKIEIETNLVIFITPRIIEKIPDVDLEKHYKQFKQSRYSKLGLQETYSLKQEGIYLDTFPRVPSAPADITVNTDQKENEQEDPSPYTHEVRKAVIPDSTETKPKNSLMTPVSEEISPKKNETQNFQERIKKGSLKKSKPENKTYKLHDDDDY